MASKVIVNVPLQYLIREEGLQQAPTILHLYVQVPSPVLPATLGRIRADAYNSLLLLRGGEADGGGGHDLSLKAKLLLMLDLMNLPIRV